MRTRPATGKYNGEEITVEFEGEYVEEDDGWHLINVVVSSVTILGADVSMGDLPDVVAGRIRALKSEVDFHYNGW